MRVASTPADLRELLTALPQIHVCPVLPRTLDEWRMSGWYRLSQC